MLQEQLAYKAQQESQGPLELVQMGPQEQQVLQVPLVLQEPLALQAQLVSLAQQVLQVPLEPQAHSAAH